MIDKVQNFYLFIVRVVNLNKIYIIYISVKNVQMHP